MKLYTKKRRTCSKSQNSVGILVQRWFKDFKIGEALLIIMAPKFGKAAPKTGKAAAKKSGAPEPAATMHIPVPKGIAKASQQTPSHTIADFFKPKPPPPAKANQTNSFQQCMLGTFAQPIDKNQVGDIHEGTAGTQQCSRCKVIRPIGLCQAMGRKRDVLVCNVCISKDVMIHRICKGGGDIAVDWLAMPKEERAKVKKTLDATSMTALSEGMRLAVTYYKDSVVENTRGVNAEAEPLSVLKTKGFSDQQLAYIEANAEFCWMEDIGDWGYYVKKHRYGKMNIDRTGNKSEWKPLAPTPPPTENADEEQHEVPKVPEVPAPRTPVPREPPAKRPKTTSWHDEVDPPPNRDSSASHRDNISNASAPGHDDRSEAETSEANGVAIKKEANRGGDGDSDSDTDDEEESVREEEKKKEKTASQKKKANEKASVKILKESGWIYEKLHIMIDKELDKKIRKDIPDFIMSDAEKNYAMVKDIKDRWSQVLGGGKAPKSSAMQPEAVDKALEKASKSADKLKIMIGLAKQNRATRKEK